EEPLPDEAIGVGRSASPVSWAVNTIGAASACGAAASRNPDSRLITTMRRIAGPPPLRRPTSDQPRASSLENAICPPAIPIPNCHDAVTRGREPDCLRTGWWELSLAAGVQTARPLETPLQDSRDVDQQGLYPLCRDRRACHRQAGNVRAVLPGGDLMGG